MIALSKTFAAVRPGLKAVLSSAHRGMAAINDLLTLP